MIWIRRNWTFISILILFVTAGWIVFTPPTSDSLTGGRIPSPREGFMAPDFELKDAAGQMVRLGDLRGQPLLLNIWASWCAPCKAEMPAMQEVYEQYAPDGFTILAVNTTFQDDPLVAMEFAKSRGVTFPILFDVNGSVSQKYRVSAMPTSFFIDSEGMISRVVFGGPMSEALLRAEIEQLLVESR